MYLLFLDESGTHGGSSVFVLGGVAVHEHDAQDLQRRLEATLADALPAGLRSHDFEIHGSEIQNPKAGRSGWYGLPYPVRARTLERLVQALASFEPRDQARAPALFGAVVDRSFEDHEERAYTDVLHKFQSMLVRRAQSGVVAGLERGLVIHDKRVVERDIQTQTQMWRRASSRIGQLTHLADVPLFADSRASRLIQAADLVCYSLWRYYGPVRSDPRLVGDLWSSFDTADGVMHGLAHVWPGYGREDCCPPCRSRAS